MTDLSRRDFLATAAAAVAVSGIPAPVMSHRVRVVGWLARPRVGAHLHLYEKLRLMKTAE